MPYYPLLRDYKNQEERTRIIENIQALKSSIEIKIPTKSLEKNLLLATWNIREFGKNTKAKRLKEAIFYIAEIISSFDLVAVQEIGRNLDELNLLKRLLGPHWDYIVTDITEGTSGNGERLAFIFDTRKVTFMKVVGEIVLPEMKNEEITQFARSPFLVAFQTGWFRFYIITSHIYFGDDGKNSDKFKRRVKEIEQLSEFLKKRSEKEVYNYILLGDFNITGSTDNDPTYNALTKNGFKIPTLIQKLNKRYTNANQDKPYDQISYIEQVGFMDFADNKNSAGIFNFFENVFKESDESLYETDFKESNLESYKVWKTYQMSDHLPLYVEFKVDFSEKYLEKLKIKEYSE